MTAAPATTSHTGLPSPAGHPVHGHLGRWGQEPLALLEEGAALGPVFELRLPRRPAVVGASPAWNRFVLRDGETFVARRSMPALIPHLAGGIITTDAPAHRPRRLVLEPRYRDVDKLRARVRAAVDAMVPVGEFDGLDWALHAVPAMLNAALFSGRFPADLLAEYLRPLEEGMPSALIPRPGARRAVRRELSRQLALRRDDPQADDLAAALASVPGAVEELRVGLAAGFDTSAHTLAWALWYLAAHPTWQPADRRRQAVDEVLRLHPPGFIGARRVARDTSFEGTPLPVGTMAFYSPMLTHRRPELWERPDVFDPTRFEVGIRAWTYIPFSAGQRTCLGTHLARLMLDEALEAVLQQSLRAVAGDPSPVAAVTIAPRGPLRLVRGHSPASSAAGASRAPHESDRP
ncbi:cytochrome P450 [Egicoccus sp. AB-alg2]|uniref:cytochrome P450 n=1 Tax=Egicoccus sp. AB-alg2 TaxID=3242693 RepID=UPI00359D3D11